MFQRLFRFVEGGRPQSDGFDACHAKAILRLADYVDWRIFGLMAVLRKIIQAMALIALMTGGVYAQVAPLPDNSTPPTKEEKQKKADDAAYKSSLRSIPATAKPTDRSVG